MLKAIHAQEGLAEACEKATWVAKKLERMKLPKAAKKIFEGIEETLVYYNFRYRSYVCPGYILPGLIFFGISINYFTL